MAKIKDFGEKIGGARKDVWKLRGLQEEDLGFMSEAEKKKYVKKRNIWERPDYEALVKDGAEIEAIFGMKLIYDSIPCSPSISLTGFISFVREMKELFQEVRSWKELEEKAREFLRVHVDGSYRIIPREDCYGLMNTKLYKALYIDRYTKAMYARKIKATQFCVPKEDRLPSGYSIVFYNGTGYGYSGWMKDTFYVCLRRHILQGNFKTRDDAENFIMEDAEKKKVVRKKRFTPPQLEHVCRRDLPDYLEGKRASGEDFLKDFFIRGGEFGEWMSEKDSQTSLDMAYEAFHDFAAALGIRPEQVSFGERLSIAFGSRGHGNACAHYEPLREVINLTKMKGAGSLGHELFHAIDDICGKKLGLEGFMTEAWSSKVPESVRNLIDTMMYRKATAEEQKAESEKQVKRQRSNVEAAIHNAFPDQEQAEKILVSLEERLPALEKGMKACHAVADELSELKKQSTGRTIRKEERNQLAAVLYVYQCSLAPTELPEMKKPTDFYLESVKMDKNTSKEKNGYWASKTEMFARAGACYLTDAIRDMGSGNGRSDYLSGHSESCVGLGTDGKPVYPFPRGEERKRINQAIREMLEELKCLGVL